jgi:hypothetical protein
MFNSFHNFKASALVSLAAVFLLAFSFLLVSVHAQEEGDLSLNFRILQLDTDYVDGNIEIYRFILDAGTLKYAKFKTFSDVVISTNFGDITFEGTVNGPGQAGWWPGSMKSDKPIDKIVINKAVGVLDGKPLDFTKDLNPWRPNSLDIEMAAHPQGCQTKKLDFDVKEGIVKGVDEGDFIYAMIEINGQEEIFTYSPKFSSFFENPANIGKKIKFLAVKEQMFLQFDGSEECTVQDIIYDIIVSQSAIGPGK